MKAMVDGEREDSQERHQPHLHGAHQLCPLILCQLAVANVPDHKDTAMRGLLQVERFSSGTPPTEW